MTQRLTSTSGLPRLKRVSFCFGCTVQCVGTTLATWHRHSNMEKSAGSQMVSKGAFVYAATYSLFSALIALEHWKKSYGPKRFRYWRIFRKNHRELQSWVARGNPNTRHLVYLLDAAYLSTKKGKDDEVKRMYDKSIAVARRGGFVHDAALANELAGVYYLNRLDTDWASLQSACHCRT
jgi:hypothetical protein